VSCDVAESYKTRYRNGFTDRLRFAWLRLKLIRDTDLIHDDLAKEVSRALGEAVPQPTVSRWFRDRLPDAPTLCALADALQVDPGWLAFGDASKAPRPDDPIAGLYESLKQPPEGGGD
jgi:transcriptional regulator with XRE-family HTH domain